MSFEFLTNTSEYQREGLKYIASEVKNVLKSGKLMKYQEICSKIPIRKPNILKRRVYDVLSVMSAMNMLRKENKRYQYIQRDYENDLKEEIQGYEKKLIFIKNMRKDFMQLLQKNRKRKIPDSVERYHLPFLLVICDSSAKIKCEINNERTYFKFSSSKSIHRLDDLRVINEMFKDSDSYDLIPTIFK